MVLLEDLATIDIDLAAVERGRARPAESVLSPGTTLVPAPERRGLFGLFS
jgi:FdhE protein